MDEMIESFKKAVAEDNAILLGQLLEQNPQVKSRINDPVGPFDSPLITMARSRAMLDVMLAAGADINARSRWWAGGFGLMDNIPPELAAYAIERGAVVDAHAAARLGMLDRLRALIAGDPELVRARGGDGQTPLHFASTVAVAEFLLDHGADIDARDIDHESSPAQYMVRDRQEVLRYLIQLGCKTDLLMAAALGDAGLIQKHLDQNPECIRMRVSDEYFPKENGKSGGTIYQWTLGWHVSAHDVAKQFGHEKAFELLMQKSPPDVRLLAACWAGNQGEVESLLAAHPDLTSQLSDQERRQIAHAARNNNLEAVKLMLAAGFPVNAAGQHKATPLHWAGFHGNAAMAREILRYNPSLELLDDDFHSTPLGWAIHGSDNGWHCRTGNYAETVEAILSAGAKLPQKEIACTSPVKEVLARHSRQA